MRPATIPSQTGEGGKVRRPGRQGLLDTIPTLGINDRIVLPLMNFALMADAVGI
jgi:hypothetical protein